MTKLAVQSSSQTARLWALNPSQKRRTAAKLMSVATVRSSAHELLAPKYRVYIGAYNGSLSLAELVETRRLRDDGLDMGCEHH